MKGVLILPDGQQVEVRDGMVLGRVAQCDVTIADAKSSRRHARLHVEGSVVEVEDLGSSNGTFLNGDKIRRRVLRPGDEVQIGKTILRYEEAAAGVASAASAEPAAGEDLFGDDDGIPGAHLEGDPRTGFIDPPAPDPVPPVQVKEPAPEPEPEPASEPAPAGDSEVEVLEFVDEVVEVRKPKAAAPPASVPGPKRVGAAKPDARSGGVLQFQGQRQASGGMLGHDLGQMSSTMRGLLVVVALAVAAGLGYLAMKLAS